MARKVGVLVFPGTNCQDETEYAINLTNVLTAYTILFRQIVEGSVRMTDYDAWVLPGGFSWGDHFGSGRVAGFAFGDYLREFAETGRPMLGICNGFQILFEAGLFQGPAGESGGALVQNESGRFEARWTTMLALPGSPWTRGFDGTSLRLPVAHGEGRWYIPSGVPSHITPLFQYARDGVPTEEYPYNPSGTPNGYCGIAKGNIMGMMPHPERALDNAKGSSAGRLIFNNLALIVL